MGGGGKKSKNCWRLGKQYLLLSYEHNDPILSLTNLTYSTDIKYGKISQRNKYITVLINYSLYQGIPNNVRWSKYLNIITISISWICICKILHIELAAKSWIQGTLILLASIK